MTYLEEKITTFYDMKHAIFKKPLEKIVGNMLNKCKYSNDDSLERHNWGGKPIKLTDIPKNLESASFEEDLLSALDLDNNEKSIVELLWGDIQLGKRVHACIIMWISVYILRRPVLYVFRNLSIDQKQLQDDIMGTENSNFNIQFIKNIFQDFQSELIAQFESDEEYWKEFKLPELKSIGNNDITNKLCNKEQMDSKDIFCCLMNHSQLEKINRNFNHYVCCNKELVNVTLLVDESDLMAPTASNDRSNAKDLKNTTLCEALLAKIYKKVKYALHITGTAHSLLYNVTTALSDNTDVQIKISKVHKMVRSNDYYGLFNNRIHFDTSIVKSWWDYSDGKKKPRFDIITDYTKNIKGVIKQIINRSLIKYNSLLISEEKIRLNQYVLVNKIMSDFANLFIIIYHGNCLRLYLSKKYEKEIQYWSEWDSNQSSTSQRLWQRGGVYDSPIDSENLPNNYCYFDINTKILNIKFLYKLLRILFQKNDQISCKTIITITGKYGERGYSFTSDDYDNYSLHLTDQYFVSHASLNCTDISQRLRLQGKYSDEELEKGEMKLTLWTTPELQDLIQNFYVKFIRELEPLIMSCESWEGIKDLLEQIFDNGELKFKKYISCIDVKKKRKNLQTMKHYDSKIKGFRLIIINDWNDTEIAKWCKEKSLPDFVCVNEIKQMDIYSFIGEFGEYTSIVPIKKNKMGLNTDELKEYIIKYFDTDTKKVTVIKPTTINMDRKNGINQAIANNVGYNYGRTQPNEYCIIDYNDEDYYHIVGQTNTKCLPKNTNDYSKKTPYFVHNNVVKFSSMKDEYVDKLPNQYYWKTPDGWLCLFDKDQSQIISLTVVEPIDNDVLSFINSCCEQADKKNLRIGLRELYKLYKDWCESNSKKSLLMQVFSKEFEKKFREQTSKGVDIHNKPGKRGYNVRII
mgnify:CR=1 FL=1|tara:strand:- start:62 stop:2806 length:2745 start_codon:yes stop_codon:yes gene_type:complete